ncbi:hypothetical protein [Croceicoccus marinus]|jgi:hypothetical protein|uniref:Uncharacterized protein n=1 Tax=Croceicoccus marinus TaxID=450378 RepID=A0A7G6VVK5_9SPHN|nr:hypothetical protein [Croceicoccus marinus]QNE05770.1 hypothetical protein H4O24_03590 [Croceicoccus marinus]
MKMMIARAALVAAPALLLAACGSTDEADAPAEADNVEMPAAEVMAQPGMEGDAAMDPSMADMTDEDAAVGATTEPAEPVVDPTAEAAADAADDAAADLSAAMEGE